MAREHDSESIYSGSHATAWAVDALLAGRRVTTLDATRELHGAGWRLAACVHKLRRRLGWNILADRLDDGRARYWLSRAEIRRIRAEAARAARAAKKAGRPAAETPRGPHRDAELN